MPELLLLKGNPARRRRSGKRRSAAQRAATARMLAANRSSYRRNPAKKKRKTRSASPAPTSRKRSGGKKRRSASRSYSGGSSIMNTLKSGAVMGAGALAVDIGMGLIGKFAPTATMITARTNADGSVNYGYFAAKIGLAVAVAKFGTRLTRFAPDMAKGALAVTAYELMKSFMPTDGSIPLGSVGGLAWFNPGRIVNGGVNMPVSRIMNTGKILPLARPISSPATASIQMMGGRAMSPAIKRHLR